MTKFTIFLLPNNASMRMYEHCTIKEIGRNFIFFEDKDGKRIQTSLPYLMEEEKDGTPDNSDNSEQLQMDADGTQFLERASD